MSTVFLDRPKIVYPDSDGQPMADNTRQYECMVMIKGGLDIVFAADPEVFVAGDHLWYPVEGHPEIRIAPDVYVAFGRPKGDRGSYKQWMEGGVAPQVVFEVLSPKNTVPEMLGKLAFYEQYGVEEHYVYDPDRGKLLGYFRQGDRLTPIPEMRGHVSPRLRVRFDLVNGDLRLHSPDGEPFRSFVEWATERDQAKHLANQEAQRANQEAQRAEHERQRAEQAEKRSAELLAKLRDAGIEPPP
jgi:Uma2 family endonuclease